MCFVHFADDTTVFTSDSDINNVHATVNRELVGVDHWLKANILSLNVSKIPNMIIYNQKNLIDIRIRESILTKVSTVKFLWRYTWWKSYFFNMDMARIQEWCNHRCMILNPNKTKNLVVSRYTNVNPLHGDFVLSGVSISSSPNHDILGVKFDRKHTFKDHVRGICRVSHRTGILRLVKRIFLDTSVLLRCYFCICSPNPWVFFCIVWVSCWMSPSASWVPCVFVVRLCPDQSFFLFYHRRDVAGLSMLNKVNSNSNHCLFSERPSVSTRVRLSQAAHPLEFEALRCRTFQFARYFLPAQVLMWNDLPYTVFNTGTVAKATVGLLKQLVNNFVFPTLACAVGLNNNNNMKGKRDVI